MESEDNEEMPPLEVMYALDPDAVITLVCPTTNTNQTQAEDRKAPGSSQLTAGHQLLDHYDYVKSSTADKEEQLDCNLSEPPERRKPLPVDQKTRPAKHYPTARELAAQALVADNGGWLIFDPNMKQGASIKYKIESFLDKYRPSRVRELNGNPVHWISAHAPRSRGDSPTTENGSDSSETEREGQAMDKDGLLQAWDDLLQSGRDVTFQEIKTIAVAHRCLVGKWLVMKETGFHVDLTWERIFRATVAGQLGSSTKVSSALEVDNRGQDHVICIYSEDFTDKSGVMTLENRLRQLGIRCRLTYKPDAFSYLGVYRRNEWGLKPTIYASEFDVRKNASVVMSVYE